MTCFGWFEKKRQWIASVSLFKFINGMDVVVVLFVSFNGFVIAGKKFVYAATSPRSDATLGRRAKRPINCFQAIWTTCTEYKENTQQEKCKITFSNPLRWTASNANTFSECSCPVRRYPLNRWWNHYRYDVTRCDAVATNLSWFGILSSVDMPRYTVALSIHGFDWTDYGP